MRPAERPSRRTVRRSSASWSGRARRTTACGRWSTRSSRANCSGRNEMKLDRRTFLRAAGVSIPLPWMDSLARGSAAAPRRRMVCICAPLGMPGPPFFPAKTGRDYEAPGYLEMLQPGGEDFTVMSGLPHPEIATGHDSQYSFLTGAHHNGFMRGGFRNTISVDHLAAEKRGGATRLTRLPLA